MTSRSRSKVFSGLGGVGEVRGDGVGVEWSGAVRVWGDGAVREGREGWGWRG